MPSFLKPMSAGAQGQTEYPIVKETTVIGRNPNSDICLSDTAVSRIHARISFDGERFTVADITSSNGTFVNGRRIAEPTLLYDGDQIQIGSGTFIFVSDLPKTKRIETQNYSVGSAILDEALSKDSISFTSQVDLRNLTQQPVIPPSSDLVARLKTLQTKLDVMMSMMKNWGKVTSRKGLLPEFFVNLLKLFPQADVISVLVPDERTSKLKLTDFRLRRGLGTAPVRISRSIPQYVFDNEKAIISDSPARDPRFSSGDDSVLKKDIYSAMAVPVFEGEKEPPIAVILVESRTGDGKFTESDLDLLIGIANQIGLYSENMNYQRLLLEEEMLEKEMALANQVQTALLPDELPAFPGYAFYVYYRPAKSIGGDFYDFIRMPNGCLAVVLADVTGKGVAAALLAAKLSSDVQNALMMEKTPAAALERINRVFHTSQLESRFITMILLVLEPDNGKLHLFNAGHETPFLRRRSGALEKVGYGKHGYAVAMMPETNCREVLVDLQPGDAFVMMTDGISSASDNGQRVFGTVRTAKFLESLKTSDPKAIGESLIAEVRRFAAGAPQADDQCVIVIGRDSGKDKAK